MSTVIDQKIVEMRFDNKQFESNVSTTMSTLDKFKKALNMDNASKGLHNVSAAAKSVNLSPLANAVQTVHARFSALDVIAVTALQNITNRAIAAGEQLVKSFTIDPIKSGFQEYETQINAVQTILANTSHAGTDLEQVNAALDELNKYADMTIYNFTEMTRNIGTFTAAGVDLETSVKSIQGIANLAAISGSTSQQASTAMYQLSQALAAGTVKLQDWNSVVNAGMGGKVFQDALTRTAAVMDGAAKNTEAWYKANIESYGSFRESLTEGAWLTTEVLTETLNQFTLANTEANKQMLLSKGYTEAQAKAILEMATTATEAATKVKTFTQLMDTLKEATQSGWTQSWEIIVGDFEEAKVLFTELSDFFGNIINTSAEARNTLLEGAMSSPWDQVIGKINEAGLATEDFQSALAETAKEHGVSLERIIREEGSLAAAMTSGRIKKELIIETFKKYSKELDKASSSTSDMADKLKYFQKAVDDVWSGKYGNGEDRIKALTKAGYEYQAVQDLVNKTVDGHRLTLKDLSDEQLKNLNLTDEQIKAFRALAEEAEATGTPLNELLDRLYKPSGRELMIDSLRNVLQALAKVIGSVSTAWKNAFPPMTSDQLYRIIEVVHSFTESLVMTDESADKLTRTLKGVFAILDLIATVAGSTLKVGFNILSAILAGFDLNILDVTASIGDAIVAFRDWTEEHNVVLKAIEALARGFKNGVIYIKEWAEAFLALPETQKFISDFKMEFNNTLNNIGKSIKGTLSNFDEFIEAIRNLDSLSLDNLKRIFDLFVKGVKNSFADIGKYVDQAKDYFAKFRDDVEGHLNKLKDGAQENIKKVIVFLGDLKDKVVEIVKFLNQKFDIDWGAIFAIGTGLVLIKFIKQLGNLFDSIAGWDLSNLFGLSDVLEAYEKKLKAQALKEVAIAIGILAASVAVLALLPFDGVVKAAGVLIVLAGALVGIAKLMPKMGQLEKFSGSMITVAGAIIILVGALKILSDMDTTNLLENVLTLGSVVAALLVVAKLLSNKDALKLPSGGLFLISFATSILILVKALKDLETTDISIKAIMNLVGVIGALALVAAASKQMKGVAPLSMLITIASLKLFLKAIDDLSTIDGVTLVKGILAFIPVVAAYKLLISSTASAGQYADKAGVAILAMSASMLIIVKAIKMIADIDLNDLVKAGAVIAALELVFVALISASNYAGQNAAKAGVMLLAMSGAILILSGVIVILSKLDPSGIWNAVGAIAVLEILFAGIIAVTYFAKEAKGTLVLISVTIGLLAVAIGALSMIDEKSLNAASKALSGVMAVLSLLIVATTFIKKGNFLNVTGTLTVLTIVITALGEILKGLSSLPVDSAIGASKSLSLLLLSLSASLLIISNAKTLAMSSYATLGAMVVAIGLIAGIMAALVKFDVAPSLETAGALSLLLLSLSGACVILSGVGGVAPMALKGALAFDGIIVIIGGLIVGLGILMKHMDGAEEFLDKGIPVLEKIGYAIGSFAGNILGGFAAGITSGLPEIGSNLSGFMDNASGFIDGAKRVDDSVATGVKALVSAILTLTKANVINSITSFLGFNTSFETFGKQILSFGQAMVDYSSIVSGSIDESAVTASANAGKTLAELTKSLPSAEGSLSYWFNGKINLSDFGRQIQVFARALVGYSEVLTQNGGIDAKAIESSASAGKTLAELANNLPAAQGTLGYWFNGKLDLNKFASQMTAFGRAIVGYSNTLTKNGGINEEAVVASANAGKALSELANSLPSAEGTFMSWFDGKIDLVAFANKLNPFARALVGYSKTLTNNGGIDAEAITASANAANALAALANNLPAADGTFMSWFDGKLDLATFGTQLKNFGKEFSSYSAYVKMVDASVVSATTNTAQSIVTLAKSLPDNKLFTNETTLDEFGKQLSKFGAHFAKYYNNISAINPSTLGGAVTELWRLVNLFTQISNSNMEGVSGFSKALTDLGKAGVDGFINAFNNASGRVSDAVSSLLNAFTKSANARKGDITAVFSGLMDASVTAIRNKYQDFYNAGLETMNKYMSGIKMQDMSTRLAYVSLLSAALTAIRNKFSDFETAGEQTMIKFIGGVKSVDADLTSAFTSQLGSAVSSIQSYYSDFYDAGEYLVDGFANGIEDNTSAATKAASRMASAALSAAEEALDENSPSKEFYKVGAFAGMGFINAFRDYEDKADKAGRNMATNSVISLQKAMSKISEFVENGIDSQPIIRPVLDLSDVEDKTSRLNSLFSTNRAMSISRQINAQKATEQIQNGEPQETSGSTFNFTQNNYSPKALSRVDIYRQTKNQFSAMERLVKA